MTFLKNLHLKTISFMIPSLILTEFIVLGFAILKGWKCIKNKINASVGLYIAASDNTKIIGGGIEDSISIGDSITNCGKKLVESLIGRNSKILSSIKKTPKGYIFTIGEHSNVEI